MRDPAQEFDQSLAIAQGQFVRGSAAAFTRLWSHGEDVTILGAFGGYERGWAAVETRLEWAASQFSEGEWHQDIVSKLVGNDIVVTVAVERTRARLGGSATPVLQELRVTHVLRREGEQWKIVHRHADPLRPTIAPAG